LTDSSPPPPSCRRQTTEDLRATVDRASSGLFSTHSTFDGPPDPLAEAEAETFGLSDLVGRKQYPQTPFSGFVTLFASVCPSSVVDRIARDGRYLSRKSGAFFRLPNFDGVVFLFLICGPRVQADGLRLLLDQQLSVIFFPPYCSWRNQNQIQSPPRSQVVAQATD
jgi:hypothetical protein